MTLEARLALEWLFASGERSKERLARLVEHFCETNAIGDRVTREAIQAQALRAFEARATP